MHRGNNIESRYYATRTEFMSNHVAQNLIHISATLNDSCQGFPHSLLRDLLAEKLLCSFIENVSHFRVRSDSHRKAQIVGGAQALRHRAGENIELDVRGMKRYPVG